jgi:hypothetical protein
VLASEDARVRGGLGSAPGVGSHSPDGRTGACIAEGRLRRGREGGVWRTRPRPCRILAGFVMLHLRSQMGFPGNSYISSGPLCRRCVRAWKSCATGCLHTASRTARHTSDDLIRPRSI